VTSDARPARKRTAATYFSPPDESKKKQRNGSKKKSNSTDAEEEIPPPPLPCNKLPHANVTKKIDSNPCWRYSPCTTEYLFMDTEGILKRGGLTAVQYNEKCIKRFCQARFITYTFEYGAFASDPAREYCEPDLLRDKGGFRNKLKACKKLLKENKKEDLFSIINSFENTEFNKYATEHDNGRQCINVDMDIGDPVYDFVLEILQLQIDLGIADPGTVAVHAKGQRGVILMKKIKKGLLDDQMPHTDLPSDEQGYISYFDTTHSESARRDYKPQRGDGGLSCFICFDSLEDFLGNPGARPHCLGRYGVSIVGGNCLHFGTGNDRNTKWKLFVHFDSPGFDRAFNVKRDKVFVSSLYTVIREKVTPYHICSRIMLYQYTCHGCTYTHPTHLNPYSYHTYPYCNFCLQNRFHVEITCRMKVMKSNDCTQCNRIESKTIVCERCAKNSTHCATYGYETRYTGLCMLSDGYDLGMPIVGGNIVTRKRYQELHRDLSGGMINAIQLTEHTTGKEDLFLDCTQIKAFIICFRQSANKERCNIIPRLQNRVVHFDVQGFISFGNELVVYNPARWSKTLLIEFNGFSAGAINKKVGFTT